jgi:hypothetical protein
LWRRYYLPHTFSILQTRDIQYGPMAQYDAVVLLIGKTNTALALLKFPSQGQIPKNRAPRSPGKIYTPSVTCRGSKDGPSAPAGRHTSKRDSSLSRPVGTRSYPFLAGLIHFLGQDFTHTRYFPLMVAIEILTSILWQVDVTYSEDCLTLNVWTKLQTGEKKKGSLILDLWWGF